MATDEKADSRYIGLSHKEAFTHITDDVKETLDFIYRNRGETTDEDLIDKVSWRLEAIVGKVNEHSD
jgi:hypothetical protein